MIFNINGGGADTSDATATPSDILSGKTAYVDGEKVTGNYVPIKGRKLTLVTENASAVIGQTYWVSKGSITTGSGGNGRQVVAFSVTYSGNFSQYYPRTNSIMDDYKYDISFLPQYIIIFKKAIFHQGYWYDNGTKINLLETGRTVEYDIECSDSAPSKSTAISVAGIYTPRSDGSITNYTFFPRWSSSSYMTYYTSQSDNLNVEGTLIYDVYKIEY